MKLLQRNDSMLKRLMTILVVAGLAFTLNGCSSSSSESESQDIKADSELDSLDAGGEIAEGGGMVEGGDISDVALDEGGMEAAGEGDVLADLGEDAMPAADEMKSDELIE